jgi:hypothetical protein
MAGFVAAGVHAQRYAGGAFSAAQRPGQAVSQWAGKDASAKHPFEKFFQVLPAEAKSNVVQNPSQQLRAR